MYACVNAKSIYHIHLSAENNVRIFQKIVGLMARHGLSLLEMKLNTLHSLNTQKEGGAHHDYLLVIESEYKPLERFINQVRQTIGLRSLICHSCNSELKQNRSPLERSSP